MSSAGDFEALWDLKARLHELIGTGSIATSSKPKQWTPAGFRLVLVWSGRSTVDPDTYSDQISMWLNSTMHVPVKLRSQLNRSNDPIRGAFLVFDNTTEMGWSLGQLKGKLPSKPLSLPPMIDGVWIAQDGVLAWHYAQSGWEDVTDHDT